MAKMGFLAKIKWIFFQIDGRETDLLSMTKSFPVKVEFVNMVLEIVAGKISTKIPENSRIRDLFVENWKAQALSYKMFLSLKLLR